MKQNKIVSRGIRNNNPLNIRIGNTWLGEVAIGTDEYFEQFVAPEYGIRAAFCILRRYIRIYHRDTIRKIISSWAPANENNTSRYIDFVSEKLGIEPDAQIDFFDAVTMCKLVSAMAQMECGVELDDKIITKGYSMA